MPDDRQPVPLQPGADPGLRAGVRAVRHGPRGPDRARLRAPGRTWWWRPRTSACSYVFAIASLAVYGTVAGRLGLATTSSRCWAACAPASQMIRYEVALGLSLVGMMMAFSTVQLPDHRRAARRDLPGGTLRGSSGCCGTFGHRRPGASSCSRWASSSSSPRPSPRPSARPSTCPRASSEIIGYFVEYSGMKFGLFMISEFVEVVVLSGVTDRRLLRRLPPALRRRVAGPPA